MYLLGYDIGSSSVKATLLEASSGKAVASAFAPEVEMEMLVQNEGWAEQDPNRWWQYIKETTQRVLQATGIQAADVKAIGIAYQMHGLVVVDKNQNVLRPSIIWCDSRAVQIGNQAFIDLGAEQCLGSYLNSPGNFTASKLKWVKENEPDIYAQIDKFMLPGDFIAMKLSGKAQTTASGLSEGILWNFKENRPAFELLEYYGIDANLIPEIVPTFSRQAEVSEVAAQELGLAPGTPIGYRAGDQPNNAYSLGVLNPGEIAATAGTSGVIYGINQTPAYDPASRVNGFLHVNSTETNPITGTLLCINGTGILNSWLRKNLFTSEKYKYQYSYPEINDIASQAPIGADGLTILPFGNGAERILQNKQVGATITGLSLTTHTRGHLARAAQEGIIFALRYGFDIMNKMGIKAKTVKAGDANMFLSPLFAQAFATVTDTVVELYNTDGSQGAARAAGVGAGIYPDYASSFVGLTCTRSLEPQKELQSLYEEIYQRWLKVLENQLAAVQ
ncbi:xylulokinase [Adhaeribacter aquaticus]|uniref:xylulokinase n=1 Tax=Adhaeribacter aquaticus TaxID=299567 RepID=UPI00047E0E55|nr:FGGY family carbohydrate kinase [Adhaeribacter aquaticus]